MITLAFNSNEASILDRIANSSAGLELGRIRVAVAYPSELGVDALTQVLSALPSWDQSTKEFLIGIDQGFTQPAALQKLSSLPGSKVSIPEWNAISKSHRLTAKRMFHPKVICLSPKSESRTVLIVGSANLTGGGMRRNAEAALILSIAPDAESDVSATLSEFDRWWRREWGRASNLSSEVLQQYALLHEQRRRQFPEEFRELEPSPTELADASVYFIEGGGLWGGSGNQLEIPAGSEVFFAGTPNPSPSDLEFWLITDAGRIQSRLQFHDSNKMWRVRLPTARDGLGNYGSAVFLFRKADTSREFRLDFVPSDSDEAESWAQTAVERGGVSVTHPGPGGRAYGWW